MRSKKGMGIGQVFVFIVAAITFSLIMIFGYRYVTEFIDKGEQVEFIKFKNDLELTIKKIYTEYGAIRITEMNIPSRYEQICFVDMDYPQELKNQEIEELRKINFIAADAWKDVDSYETTDQNVFTTPSSDVKIKVYDITLKKYVENVGTQVGFLCYPIVGGRFTLNLEGKGSHTEIFIEEK
jgi:hypothetical protein